MTIVDVSAVTIAIGVVPIKAGILFLGGIRCQWIRVIIHATTNAWGAPATSHFLIHQKAVFTQDSLQIVTGPHLLHIPMKMVGIGGFATLLTLIRIAHRLTAL